MTSIVPWARRGALLAAGLSATYLGLVTGAVPVDIGVARRTRPLGPIEIQIGAPPDVVFDVIEQPQATRTSRAMQAKVQVLDRGTDMVLAAHRTGSVSAGGTSSPCRGSARWPSPFRRSRRRRSA